MSSGMSRISWMTVPEFCNRLFSSFAFSSAGRANDKGVSTSAPAKKSAKRFITMPSMIFFRRFVLLTLVLIATPVGCDNNDPADQRQRSKNRRKRNGVMFFFRRLDRTDVDDFFLSRV